MTRTCKTTCVRCGLCFDRYSGKLLNLADAFLPTFYKLPSVQKALSIGKQHPTLCSDCLEQELGRSIKFSEIKYKNKKWMTSNVIYILNKLTISDEQRNKVIESVKELDTKGVLPFYYPKDNKELYDLLTSQGLMVK